MVEKQKPRDIRAFFASFAKPAKRSADERVDAEKHRSKSPRVSEGANQRNGQDVKRTQRTVIDLSTSHNINSEESDDDELQKEPASQGNQPSSSLTAPGSSSTALQSSKSQIPSSQRIVKNGEVLITNSDDEGDSDSAVEDLDELLGLFKSEKTAKVATPPLSSYSSKDDADHVEPQPRMLPPAEKGLKRHFRVDSSVKSRRLLQDLVSKTGHERAMAEGRRQALTAINESDSKVQELEAKIKDADVSTSIDQSTLASMMGDKAENSDYDKLVQAMKRTEALQSQLEWSCFGDLTPDLNLAPRPPEILQKWFGQRRYVEAAMTSGFLDDLIIAGDIQADKNLLEWTLVAALTSPRDDLHTTYSALLRSEGSENHLNGEWTWQLFSLMGASWEALNESIPVKPQIRLGAARERDSRNWPRVLRLLRIIKSTSTRLPSETRRKTLCLLSRLSLDSEVCAHHPAQIALQETVNALLDSIPIESSEEETSVLIESLSRQIPHARFRTNLLRTFLGPAPRTLLFRRKLALAFFVDGTEDPPQQKTSDLLTFVTTQLTTQSRFKISADMDFSWLAAIIESLDVAVGDGHDAIEDLEGDAIGDFNRRVDRLADHVKSIATRIRDSGANHLSRTEAKENLDALHARLLYAVRTEPRPKKSIFGASVGGPQMGSESMMERFIQRTKHEQETAEIED